MSRSSDIWQYFDVSAVDVTRVNCKLCNASLSRGGTGKKASFNTSNLRKHLRCTHDDKWQEILQKEEAAASVKKADIPPPTPTSHQPTLAATLDRKRPWDFDDANSRRIHRLIGEMIALDSQPFNIMNNEGMKTAKLFKIS